MKHIYAVRKPGSQLELCAHVSFGPCVPVGSRRYLSLVEKSNAPAERFDILCSTCPEQFVIWTPTTAEVKHV